MKYAFDKPNCFKDDCKFFVPGVYYRAKAK